MNTRKGQVVLEKVRENCLTKVALADQERDHGNFSSEGWRPPSGVDATVRQWLP